ncbi:MAG: HutD family protein [Candidatus Nanopelagicales bacterium]|jgi:environmental stress-induced protein Ves
MTGFEVIRHADLRETPWANGAGTTRQVASAPVDSGIDSFDWRISVAEVAKDCAFSAFPGIDRTIMLVEGEAMVLAIDGLRRPLEPFVPVGFAGEADVTCTIPRGPTRDLNVMCRRGVWSGSVDVVDARASLAVESFGGGALFLCAFGCRWEVLEPVAVSLEPGDFVRLTRDAVVRASGPVIRIRLTSHPCA